MSKIIQSTFDALLYLVRLSMGTDTPKSVDNSVDWNAVMELARIQGVGAITFDAIENLYNEGIDVLAGMERAKKIRAQWFGTLLHQEQVFACQKKVISKLASFYSKNGIDIMILKGYGLSLNYPNPNHRPCGDIDIWLRGRQQEADILLAQNYGIQPKKSSHHTIFEIEGCKIENHITILEHDTHRSNIPIDDFLTKLANDKEEVVLINGERVMLPTSEFNSYFLLRHCAIHFFVEGITIRHLLDWATFVVRYSNELDWDALYEFAISNNLDKFLSCINAICVDYLGFNIKEFPIRRLNKDLELRILGDVLKKEFNEEIPDRHQHFLKYCYIKTKRLWANRWKSRITNTDSFISAFFCYAKNRITEDII